MKGVRAWEYWKRRTSDDQIIFSKQSRVLRQTLIYDEDSCPAFCSPLFTYQEVLLSVCVSKFLVPRTLANLSFDTVSWTVFRMLSYITNLMSRDGRSKDSLRWSIFCYTEQRGKKSFVFRPDCALDISLTDLFKYNMFWGMKNAICYWSELFHLVHLRGKASSYMEDRIPGGAFDLGS